MKFFAIALCCLTLTGSASTYLEGDVRWLSEQKCSFADPTQCALEAHAKDALRWGRVRVESDATTKNEIELWGSSQSSE